jgi:uncharacterized damage-inducible protein DinB
MDYQQDLMAEFDREAARTRKMLAAIPDGADLAYKPHEKSMPLGRLAGHLSDMTGEFGMTILTTDKIDLPADHKWNPYIPESKAALLERFDGALPATRKQLAATTPEKWDQNWQFIFGGQTFVDGPRHQVFRDMVMNHMVHHRAQVGVYIRLLGGALPGTYGPSADGM